MKIHLILTFSISAIVSLPAFAEVDPKIHKLCIEAKDYAGCVKAMKGEVKTNKQVGNRCPSGFAYVGGNKRCQKVGCKYRWWMAAGGMKHNPLVAGKSSWTCIDQWSGGTLNKGVLTLNDVSDIKYDSECPPISPEIGWNNSCETAPENWKELEEAKGPKCNFKLHKYDCNYDSYLDANPSMKQWAELNPAMAEKERMRLQSVD